MACPTSWVSDLKPTAMLFVELGAHILAAPVVFGLGDLRLKGALGPRPWTDAALQQQGLPDMLLSPFLVAKGFFWLLLNRRGSVFYRWDSLLGGLLIVLFASIIQYLHSRRSAPNQLLKASPRGDSEHAPKVYHHYGALAILDHLRSKTRP